MIKYNRKQGKEQRKQNSNDKNENAFNLPIKVPTYICTACVGLAGMSLLLWAWTFSKFEWSLRELQNWMK